MAFVPFALEAGEFALSELEAGAISRAANQAVVFGANRASSALSTWAPYIGTAIAGALGYGGVVYMGRKRERSGSSRSSRDRKRRRSERKRRRRYTNPRTGGYLGIEKKYVDYEYNAAIVGSVAGAEADPSTYLALNAIQQGDGQSNRDGFQVDLLSLHLQGHVLFSGVSSASPITTPMARILVVLDQQTNGAQLNAEDVLSDPGDANLDVNAFRNLQYTTRFRTLKDIFLARESVAAVWDGANVLSNGSIVPWECHIDLKGMTTRYNNTTASVANIVDNSLHVICICTNGSTAQLRYQSRVRFMG